MQPSHVRIEDNAALTRIFARLPANVQRTFTPEQLEALGLATYEDPTPHAVAIRRTAGAFGRRYYLAIFAGRDRRGRGGEHVDLAEEFRADWRYIAVFVVLLAAVVALIYVTGWAFWSSVAKFIGGEISSAPDALGEFFAR